MIPKVAAHITLFLLLCALGVAAKPSLSGAEAAQNDPDFSKVDGRVIAYLSAKTDKFIGLPTLVKMGDGTLLAGYSEVGPSSDENWAPSIRLYRSNDGGQTWSFLRDVPQVFNATLFCDDNALYLIGTNRHDGDVLIRRSEDGGLNWSAPATPEKGLLLQGKYIPSSGPVAVYKGRAWYVVEQMDAGHNRSFPKYATILLSAPANTNLLDAKNWTASTPVHADSTWLDGHFSFWFGGNPVPMPNGVMGAFLNVQAGSLAYAAILPASPDGTKLDFNPSLGFVKFNGGASHATVRCDEAGNYWTLANVVPERYMGPTPARTQNTLALCKSDDLKTWHQIAVILHKPNPDKIGFRGNCWIFDGDDICFVSASAADDRRGGAFNGQSPNMLTFHRIANFRNTQKITSVPIPEVRKSHVQTADLEIEGRDFRWVEMDRDAQTFSNREFLWETVPSKFTGWNFTQLAGGVRAQIRVKALKNTEVFVATKALQDLAGLSDWEPVSGMFFAFNDRLKTKFHVYRKQLKAGEQIWIPQMEWHGTFVIAP